MTDGPAMTLEALHAEAHPTGQRLDSGFVGEAASLAADGRLNRDRWYVAKEAGNVTEGRQPATPQPADS